MIFVVRLHPKCEINTIWKFVERTFKNKKAGGVIPLYVSQRDDQHYVDIIIETKSSEGLAEFLIKEVPKCKEIDDTRTVTLMKPAFYPVSSGAGKDLKRFVVSISVKPHNYRTVFNRLLKLKFPKDIHFIYVAYTFGDEDIIASALAKDCKTMRKFVRERVRNLPGIMAAKPHLIRRSKRLATKPVWKRTQKKYSAEKITGIAPKDEFDYDWTLAEECVVHGALPDEF